MSVFIYFQKEAHGTVLHIVTLSNLLPHASLPYLITWESIEQMSIYINFFIKKTRQILLHYCNPPDLETWSENKQKTTSRST